MVRTIEGLMLMQLIVLKWDEARDIIFVSEGTLKFGQLLE